MSSRRDFNFRAPSVPVIDIKCSTHPSTVGTRFHCYDRDIKTVTLSQAQISAGVRESMVRSGTGSSLPAIDWVGTSSRLIPTSTSSTVSSLTPKLSTLHLPPSTVTSPSGSSLSLTTPKSTTTTITMTTSQSTTVFASESKINTAGRFFEPSYKFAKKSSLFLVVLKILKSFLNQ